METGNKLVVVTLLIFSAAVMPALSQAQYGFGYPGLACGTFNPVAYFRPISGIGGPGYPGIGPDPFNPFIYGSVWNPLSFNGPFNINLPETAAINTSSNNETENNTSTKEALSPKG